MNGHVLYIFGYFVHKNQFSCTLEELEGYVGVNFKKYPEDTTKMVATLQDTKNKAQEIAFLKRFLQIAINRMNFFYS